MARDTEASGIKCENNGDTSNVPLSIEDQLTILLRDGAQVPADIGSISDLPPWFDWDKFRRGQCYFRENYFAFFVSKLSGLLVVLSIPSILRVLVFTAKSAEPVAAFRRYLSTLSHMLDWYEGDLLEPTSRAHKSLLGVRNRHCSASKRARKSGMGPITQLDMALTQFGFMGFGLLQPKKLGLQGSQEDVEGFVHFWRTVGYLLGIEDRFNICRESLLETTVLCHKILEQVVKPSLLKPPGDFPVMSRSLLHGMWAMVPFLDYDAFLGFTRHLADVGETSECFVQTGTTIRGIYSKSLLVYQMFVHEVLLTIPIISTFVRFFLNLMMWLSVYLTCRTPLLAYLTFGKENVTK